MIRRPLLWILTGWILGELLAAWLGLVEVPASSYYASEAPEISLAFLEQGKATLRESLRRLAADDVEEGIFTALLLGDRRSLSEDTYSLFQNGGIAHIIAISGLHLSLIAGAAAGLLRRLGLSKKAATLGADLLLLLYVIMIGGAVSAWRAYIMFTVRTGALFAKRTHDAPSALGLAGLLILLTDPLYLFNAAFQLSFGAVWALTVAAPVLIKWLGAEKRSLAKVLLSSATVQLVTFPLVAWHFYKLPIYGVFLNLLVVPLAGVALASLLAAALAALVYVPGGVFLCGLAHYVFLGIRWLCGLMLRLPGALWVTGQPLAWQLAMYYGLLGAALVMMKVRCRKVEERKWEEKEGDGVQSVVVEVPGEDGEGPVPRWKKRAAVGELSAKAAPGEAGDGPVPGGGGTGHATSTQGNEDGTVGKPIPLPDRYAFRIATALALCLLVLLLQRPARTNAAVTALYVGQGDCAVLELPGRSAILIDGGSSTMENVGSKVILSYLQKQGVREVPAVFLSHPDADHINGIPALLGIPGLKVGMICASEVSRDSPEYGTLQEAARAAGVDWVWMKRGDHLKAGRLELSVQFEGLATGGDNDQSMVLLMEYGNFSALFMGDAEAAAEAAGSPWPQVDLLKAGHHGSRFSSGEAFLEETRPRLVFISAGRNNLYGHPHEETLARLAALGARVHVTAEEGNITLELAGE